MKALKWNKTTANFLAGAIFIILAFVFRKNLEPRFVWAFLCFGLGLLFLSLVFRKTALTYVGICLFSLFTALSAGEYYLYSQDKKIDTGGVSFRTFTQDGKEVQWIEDDPVTGYRPKPSSRIRAHQVVNNATIYDAVYTMDEKSRRLAPNHPDAQTALIFLGCSFTYGICLNDDDIFVNRLSELLGQGYQAFNLGFSGYGTHQFLALSESDRIADIAKGYAKAHVFILSLAGHHFRAAGLHNFEPGAPWYELDGQGKPVKKGVFAEKAGRFATGIDRFFSKSRLYKRFFKTAHVLDEAGAERLNAALLKQSAENIAAIPNADLTILLWPGNTAVERDLADTGIALVRLDDAVPGFLDDPTPYIVIGDGHPNPLANGMVADYLARHIRQMDAAQP